MSGKIVGKKARRNTRAGLHLYPERIGKTLRADATGLRVTKNTDIVLAALVEATLESLLTSAATRITKGSHITTPHVMETIRQEDGPVANVFPVHAAGIN